MGKEGDTHFQLMFSNPHLPLESCPLHGFAESFGQSSTLIMLKAWWNLARSKGWWKNFIILLLFASSSLVASTFVMILFVISLWIICQWYWRKGICTMPLFSIGTLVASLFVKINIFVRKGDDKWIMIDIYQQDRLYAMFRLCWCKTLR